MSIGNLDKQVTFADALRFWFKLGFINFGGPAGQIAIMHRELVERRQWISEERFLHALNFCMLLPGPEAQQLATYIGWLQHGVRGGIAAGVLFVLPGFLLIVAISWVYSCCSAWTPLQGLLFGIKAAVLAVVVEAVVRIGKRALKNRLSWWIAACAFVSIFALGVPFPIIVIAAAILGFTLHRWRPGWITNESASKALSDAPEITKSRPSLLGAAKVVLVCGVLWVAPIGVVFAILGPTHVLTLQGIFFSKMAVVTFGGAYAVLSYVAQQAVDRFHWLSADDMLQGLGLAETTPGPLILVLTYVGFLAAFRDAAPFDPILAGVIGATLATWVTFVPCFLWIFLGAPHIEGLRHHQPLSAALSMITAAVVGVILNLAVWFALHALFREVTTVQGFGLHMPLPHVDSIDGAAVAIAILAAVTLLRFKWPMLVVLAMSAGIGLLVKVV